MLLGVFSVYDSKAKAYLPPFFMVNDHVAVRTFVECANDPGHMFCKHSTDFTLFKLAHFEDSKGEFQVLKNPENLGIASSFKENRVVEEEV